MAYQAGPLRFKGKLGGLSFYHNKQYGYLVRQKGGPDKEQIATSPSFARTRENAVEFSLASTTGKLIRQAMRSLTALTGDSNVSQRLTGLLVRMGKSDLSATRGMRNPARVFNDSASRLLLRSFAFYVIRPIGVTYTGHISCDTSTGSIVFTKGTGETPALAAELFRGPKGATHVQIKAAVVTLDFENNLYKVYPAPIYTFSLENSMTQAEFICVIDPTDSHSRMGVVAIEFLQEKNGDLYALADGVSLGIVG